MKEQNLEELKDRLQRALARKGWKAVDLVEQTNIPKGAISYYMAGKSKPKADRLYILAKALDVSEAWLLGYDVPMVRSEGQKKNDQLAELIAKLRTDERFYATVATLAELPEHKYKSIELLVATLDE